VEPGRGVRRRASVTSGGGLVLMMAAGPKGQVRIESCRWGGGGGAMGYRSVVRPCAGAVSAPGGRRGTGHRRRQGGGGDMVRKKPVA
jgi:hypothetical protein